MCLAAPAGPLHREERRRLFKGRVGVEPVGVIAYGRRESRLGRAQGVRGALARTRIPGDGLERGLVGAQMRGSGEPVREGLEIQRTLQEVEADAGWGPERI